MQIEKGEVVVTYRLEVSSEELSLLRSAVAMAAEDPKKSDDVRNTLAAMATSLNSAYFYFDD